MSRIFRLYLEDILKSCRNIRTYVSAMTFDEFSSDQKTIDAVVRNLEIIGEAVKSLPTESKEANPEIPWKKIARFRDLIAHHYFSVNIDMVWDILKTKLTPLEKTVEEMLTVED